MADFFLDSNEQPAAETSEVAVSDPAADFLAGEQSDLAEIEGQVYDQVPVAEDSFDPFAGGGNEATELEADFIQSATVIEPAPPSPEPTPAFVPSYTVPKIEPEIIKQWREEFKQRTEDIECEAESQAEEWRAAAKEALEKFYADRDEKLEKTRKINRESADALKVDTDTFDTADMNDSEKWEKVTQRIDFNSKGSCTKDNSRMRQVLLQLKAAGKE